MSDCQAKEPRHIELLPFHYLLVGVGFFFVTLVLLYCFSVYRSPRMMLLLDSFNLC